MRQRLPFLVGLGLGVALVGLGFASRLQAQAPSKIKSPHGTLDLDCAECHTPERWTPVLRTPIFRHESTGFLLQGSHSQVACGSCHRSLVFSRVGTACVDCHQDAHRGELGHGVRELSLAAHLVEPARDVPGAQQDALPALRGACEGGLPGLPPRPAALRVRHHLHRVRELPCPRLRGHHQPQPRGRGLLAPLRRLPPPHRHELAGLGLQPRDLSPAGGPRAHGLRAVPHRGVPRHPAGLRGLPSVELRPGHEPQPRDLALPAAVRLLPPGDRAGGRRAEWTTPSPASP